MKTQQAPSDIKTQNSLIKKKYIIGTRGKFIGPHSM